MSHETFLIDRHAVGPDHDCLIVAEVAQAHDGSLGTAHAFIDAVARTGADAIKFQTHIAAAESTPGEPWRVKFSRQDASRYDYWRRMEFSAEHWRGLAEHAKERELLFLSSPFSEEAVELLASLDVPAWKVGAGETNNVPMLERVAALGKPVLLSSGMSPWSELDQSVALLRAAGCPHAVLQCTSRYPCPVEKIGLNVIAELRERYGCPVGLSDHSGQIYAGLGAAALGADIIEVHVTLSREAFGPDVASSLTVDELAALVEGARYLRRARAHPIDKDVEAESLAEMRALFNKSLVAARDLPAGHRLERADVRLKKPGDGIPADRLAEVLGRSLTVAVSVDEQLQEQHLV